MTPKPPSCAMAPAIASSVTVSMHVEMMGILSSTPGPSTIEVSHSDRDRMSLYCGTRRTSS